MVFLTEYPFDTVLKRMTVTFLDEAQGKKVHYAKGALERVLEICTHHYMGDAVMPMTDEFLKSAEEHMLEIAGRGMRVLALAVRREMEKPPAMVDYDPRLSISHTSLKSNSSALMKEQVRVLNVSHV
jgi:magnesium-transporting ATPase (P-type)